MAFRVHKIWIQAKKAYVRQKYFLTCSRVFANELLFLNTNLSFVSIQTANFGMGEFHHVNIRYSAYSFYRLCTPNSMGYIQETFFYKERKVSNLEVVNTPKKSKNGPLFL